MDLILVAAPLAPLALTLLNAATWDRCPPGEPLRGVSALVPMRDEVDNVDGCIGALLAAGVDEVIVYDDASTDGTGARVAAIGDPRVRLLRGHGPLRGWLGKPHACHRLAAEARHPHLLFVDADVRVAPDLLARLGPAMVGTDALSAMPGQVTGSSFEHLVLPMLHVTVTSWLPLAAVPWLPSPSMAVANGQLWLLTRAAYDAVGGFAAVRDEVAEDMALARRVKRQGLTLRFVDGQHMAMCRMYQSARGVVDGFSKNLWSVMGGNPVVMTVVLTAYLGCLLLPWLAWPFAPVAGLGVAANLAQRAVLAWRHGHRVGAVLLHPVAVVVFSAIALRSAWWAWSGGGSWRGRALREAA